MFEHLVDAYPNDVQLVYRHFPLNQIHAHAQKAAESAEAANAQGAFWEYHTALFESQADWANLSSSEARDHFIGIAEEIGLDAEQFAADCPACLNQHPVEDVVDRTTRNHIDR